ALGRGGPAPAALAPRALRGSDQRAHPRPPGFLRPPPAARGAPGRRGQLPASARDLPAAAPPAVAAAATAAQAERRALSGHGSGSAPLRRARSSTRCCTATSGASIILPSSVNTPRSLGRASCQAGITRRAKCVSAGLGV